LIFLKGESKMNERESIEPAIIKSERVNKPCESKPTMDMLCNMIMDILADCSATAHDTGYELLSIGGTGSNSDLRPAKENDTANQSVYDKLAIIRDRAYVLNDTLRTIRDGVSQ
jgi:hypothetical protein